jgi:hypothetical protein
MSSIDLIREQRIHERSNNRHQRELTRIHQIKSSKPHVPLASRNFLFKSHDDVIKRYAWNPKRPHNLELTKSDRTGNWYMTLWLLSRRRRFWRDLTTLLCLNCMRCVTKIFKRKFAFSINLFNFSFAPSISSHFLVPMLVEVIPVSRDSDQFQCSILKIGNLRILLDCGWTESLDTEQYAALSPEVFSGIDAVLISHYSFPT